MKLFMVESYLDYIEKTDTSTAFVVAENEAEAKRIAEEELYSLSGMETKEIKEVNMSYPHLLCAAYTGFLA